LNYRLLIINPGSTATKMTVYENEREVFEETLRHSPEDIGKFKRVVDQQNFRTELILKILQDNQIDVREMDAIVRRGELLKPIISGTYNYILKSGFLGARS
jgi:butyrate kinase